MTVPSPPEKLFKKTKWLLFTDNLGFDAWPETSRLQGRTSRNEFYMWSLALLERQVVKSWKRNVMGAPSLGMTLGTQLLTYAAPEKPLRQCGDDADSEELKPTAKIKQEKGST